VALPSPSWPANWTAGLLGGFLRLAAVSPQVAQVLEITGLHRHLANFPTVHAASTGAGGAELTTTPWTRRHDRCCLPSAAIP
jgi:hypothetical protein